MAVDKYLVDKIIPIIDTKINNRKLLEIMKVISEYKDSTPILLQDGPYTKVHMDGNILNKAVFNEYEKNKIFEILDISAKDIKKIIKECDYIKSSWTYANDSFNIFIGVLIVYIHKSDIVKEKKKYCYYLSSYLAFRLYPSRLYASFPEGIIEKTMLYTINRLTKNFLIKKSNNMMEAIDITAKGDYENYIDDMLIGTDKSIVDYINGMNTRIGSLIKNIAEEYYKDHKAGHYMNYEFDNPEEENYHKADSDLYSIERIVSKSISFMQTRNIEIKLVDLAAQTCGVRKLSLLDAIKNIYEYKSEEVEELIRLLVTSYMLNIEGATVIKASSNHFFIEINKLYKKNNTKDEGILKIKEILHSWLTECSEQYRKTNREATMNKFKKALFVYFVLYVQVSNR